jgi:hypothetical protein
MAANTSFCSAASKPRNQSSKYSTVTTFHAIFISFEPIAKVRDCHARESGNPFF